MEEEVKELAMLRLKEKPWAIEKKTYEPKIEELQRIIWGKKSERLANLFTLVENCRLLGIDPERYLIGLLTRLQDHPANRIAELLPLHSTGAKVVPGS